MSTITLTAADGHSFSAYRAVPDGATMGLVVLQEIFGVNSHMRFASDALAASGFAVIAPALFDRAEKGVELGYTQEDVQTGLALRARITDEQVMMDVEAAAAALGLSSIGIIGYCWGGTIAWWGATRSDRFKGGGRLVWRRHRRDQKRDAPLPCTAALRGRGSRHSADGCRCHSRRPAGRGGLCL